jgi:hypothetical protein
MSRAVTVSLTPAEIEALLQALGNSLTGDPDDETAILGTGTRIRSAYRGQSKLIRALNQSRFS